MKVSYDISQINAELLLHYLYPELDGQWTAHCAGTFYRNYNNDQLSIYEEVPEVVLARDGFLKLLPEALLSNENELRGKHVAEKYKALERRKKLFREAFQPFDTFAFRQKLRMEQHTSELLGLKLDYLLKTCFHYDLAAESNPYVREMAVLLPYVSKLRADFRSIARLLRVLLDCKVRMRIGRYSHVDTTRCWVPNVNYQLLISGLSAEEYQKLRADIAPLQQFITEWMIPAEMRCEISIKEPGLRNLEPETWNLKPETSLLDYNTKIYGH